MADALADAVTLAAHLATLRGWPPQASTYAQRQPISDTAMPGSCGRMAGVSGRRAELQGDDHMITVDPPVRAPERRRAQVNDLLPLGDWLRHHTMRSWTVWLFLVLICVPSIALVILGVTPSVSNTQNSTKLATKK